MRVCVCSLATDLQEPPATAAPPPTPATPGNNSALKLLSLTLKISLKLSKTFNGGGKRRQGGGRRRQSQRRRGQGDDKCQKVLAVSLVCPLSPHPVCCRSVPNEAKAKQKANKRNRKRKKTRTKNCSILYCASRRKCPLSKLIRPTCVQATACVCVCECVFYFNLRVKHLHCASCHAPRQIMNFVNAVAALGIP